jgi:hypothetical protein
MFVLSLYLHSGHASVLGPCPRRPPRNECEVSPSKLFYCFRSFIDFKPILNYKTLIKASEMMIPGDQI